jgi:rubredoxin
MIIEPGLGLKADERTHGVLLVWTCPRCEEERAFHLIERGVTLNLLGADLGRRADMLDARCVTCGYEHPVDPAEAERLKVVAEATARYLTGRLPADPYRQAVEQAGTKLVAELKALVETWKCPTCGEDNPASFDACWKCAESDADEESSAESPPEGTSGG